MSLNWNELGIAGPADTMRWRMWDDFFKVLRTLSRRAIRNWVVEEIAGTFSEASLPLSEEAIRVRFEANGITRHIAPPNTATEHAIDAIVDRVVGGEDFISRLAHLPQTGLSAYAKQFSTDVCEKTQHPLVGAYSTVTLGYGYAVGLAAYGEDYSVGNPAREAEEWGLSKNTTVTNWVGMDGEIDFWVEADQGMQAVNVFMRNCYSATGDYGSMSAYVFDIGYAPGRPRPALRPLSFDLTAPLPSTFNLRNMIAWLGDEPVTNVIVYRDAWGATMIYNGPLAATMNADFECDAIGTITLSFGFTNAAGQVVLDSLLTVNDPLTLCP